MAKKNTTGGPRARRLTAADVERRREYKSRAERERMWQRRILIVFGILAGVILIVLAYAVIADNIIRPRQTILAVNDDTISTSDFADRVRFMRWQTANQIRELYMLTGGDADLLSQYAGEQISQLRSPALMGGTVLDELQDDLLIEQYAEEQGITVDDAAIDQAVDEFMAGSVGLPLPGEETATPTTEPSVTPTPLVSPTPSSTPAPTSTQTPTATTTPVEDEASATPGPTLTPTVEPTITLTPTPTATLEPQQVNATLEKAADTYFENAEEDADADRETVRKVFYYQALRQAVFEDLTKDEPLEELQVNARHILISFSPDVPEGQTAPPPTEEEKAAALARAEEVMAALQSGEPFADLAKEASDDTGSATQGGELGWSSPEGFVEPFKDSVLNANLGEIVGPVETEFGYHIIQVMDREVRPLTEDDLNQRKSQTFTEWLDEATAAADIERREDWVDRVPEDPTFEDLLGDILQ